LLNHSGTIACFSASVDASLHPRRLVTQTLKTQSVCAYVLVRGVF